MPRPVYQPIRWSIQCSCQLCASGGGTKYSISICSNSRMRKTKLPGVISLRNDLPIWAIPNGGFLRANESTFLKLTKIPCAVSRSEEHTSELQSLRHLVCRLLLEK